MRTCIVARFSAVFVLAFCFLAIVAAGCGGGTMSQGTPPTPTSPKISSISPTSVIAGSAAFTLQVTGSGFVSGSVVTLNGTALTTTYASSVQLSASVPTSLIGAGGALAVAVINPDGQSSPGNTSVQLGVNNGAPTITHLMPSMAVAGSPATNIVVTGTNFVSSSVASFQGVARTTTVQTSTQLTVALTAADLAVVQNGNITVTNPAPGGGTSNAVVFTISAPGPPVLATLAPSSAIVGSQDTALTVTGTGFTANSLLITNGFPLTTKFVSSTTLTATIPAQDLVSANPVSLYVEDNGAVSNSLPFAVLNPVPVIHSISPATITAGAPNFQLLIYASALVNSSQVLVNGVVRQSSFGLSANMMAIDITAAEVASVTTLDISIVNPAPGGGTSSTLKLNCIAGDNRLRSVNMPANALVWDPKQQRIYAAIPATASSNASSIVAIDPASGSIVASQPMPSEPALLSITDDQQYLYVSLPAIGSIGRLKLPSLAPDIQWNVYSPITNGLPTITGLQAAPGLPHTVAVAQLGGGSSKALAIYDDGVARPNFATTPVMDQQQIDSIQWGADATVMYGAANTISGGVEFHFSINSSGATLTDSEQGVFGDFTKQIVYDQASANLYDGYGHVVDPPTGRLVGTYSALNSISYEPNDFVVDSSLNRVFFINEAPYAVYPDQTGGTQIQVFDEKQHNYLDSLDLPATSGGGSNLIRWGSAGLAFVSGNSIYILDGPFVAPGTPASSAVGGYAAPAPALTALSPESVMAGSADTVVTISGQGFTDSTSVTWNGNVLESALLSPTQMQLTIPAAALVSPVAGPIIATNDPNDALSNPLGFTVTPNLGAGMQFTTLNVAGYDLLWNAAAGLLYESVTAQDLVRGNSIVSIDPVAGVVKGVQLMANEPYVLAISGDDQYLYAGFTANASVERFDLPTITPDLNIPLGAGDSTIGNVNGALGTGSSDSCDFAVSVQVAPGTSQTIAVAQGNSTIEPIGCGAVAIFDGATPRSETLALPGSPDFSNLVWGSDSTALYAQSTNEITPQSLSVLNVSPAGVSFSKSLGNNNYLGYRPHFDAGTGYIYSDGGSVTNPADGTQVGNFMASGLMVPDATLGRAFFLGQTPNQNNYGQASTSYTLQIFDLTHFTLLDSIVIPNVIGLPSQMVRWGASGIAFTTEGGNYQGGSTPGLTYILSGPVLTGAAKNKPVSAETPHVHLTWHPGRTKPKSSLQ